MKKLFLFTLMVSVFIAVSYSQEQATSRIRAGDIIQITVWGEPYLDALVKVSPEGTINYPSGEEESLPVSGLTVQELETTLKRVLRKNFPTLEDYDISVVIQKEAEAVSEEQSVAIYKSTAAVLGEQTENTNQESLSLLKKEEVPEERPSYKISPYDVLEISVYGEPDLTKTVRVSEEGKIRYPLLGEVEVEGLSVEEVAHKLEELLKEDYLVEPEVSVYIEQYATFSVLGLVNQKGSFELKGPLTLVDALVLAQGTEEDADLSHIRVFRRHGVRGGKEEEYIVDLETEGKSFFLKPLDRVVVERKGKIYILGAVDKPGVYYIKEKELSLSDALVFLAGGVTEEANVASIKVTRKENGLDKEYTLDLDTQGTVFFLQSQDRIVVPAYGHISIFGQVKQPGRYPFKKGLTAVDAIAMAGGFTTVAAQNAVRVIREKEGKKEVLKVPVGYILKSGNVSRDVELEEEDTIVVPESWF